MLKGGGRVHKVLSPLGVLFLEASSSQLTGSTDLASDENKKTLL